MNYFVIWDEFVPAERGDDTDNSFWRTNNAKGFAKIEDAQTLFDALEAQENDVVNLHLTSTSRSKRLCAKSSL